MAHNPISLQKYNKLLHCGNSRIECTSLYDVQYQFLAFISGSITSFGAVYYKEIA